MYRGSGLESERGERILFVDHNPKKTTAENMLAAEKKPSPSAFP